MGCRISQTIEYSPQFVPDGLAMRVNWSRVAFAVLLAATGMILVTVLVTLRFQAVSERILHAGSGGASSLQLVAEPASQGTDCRPPLVPLGIFVRGPSELVSAARVEIIGLPRGSVVSAGQLVGDHWRIPAAGLSGTTVLPPRRFSGAVDLEVELRLADDTLVERQSVHRVMTGPDLAIDASIHVAGGAVGGTPSPCLPPGRATEGSNLRVAVLLDKAERLLAEGDMSSARLLLRRIAETGSVRGALLLGETYEACLFYSKVNYRCSVDADSATARTWYEMAAERGSVEARQRLECLVSEESGRRAAKPSIPAES